MGVSRSYAGTMTRLGACGAATAAAGLPKADNLEIKARTLPAERRQRIGYEITRSRINCLSVKSESVFLVKLPPERSFHDLPNFLNNSI